VALQTPKFSLIKLALRAALPARRAALWLVLFAGAASCAASAFERGELRIERNGAGALLMRVEFARTAEERARGLMYRKRLPDGEGMLFIFERDEALSFWMKHTLIPLSIAFIASDGRIVEIKDMRAPGDLTPVRSSRSVRYALEVPQGWFARAGVQAGDVMRLGAGAAGGGGEH
jgi:uncharacterized membrane protein (UPF0127 family)